MSPRLARRLLRPPGQPTQEVSPSRLTCHRSQAGIGSLSSCPMRRSRSTSRGRRLGLRRPISGVLRPRRPFAGRARLKGKGFLARVATVVIAHGAVRLGHSTTMRRRLRVLRPPVTSPRHSARCGWVTAARAAVVAMLLPLGAPVSSSCAANAAVSPPEGVLAQHIPCIEVHRLCRFV